MTDKPMRFFVAEIIREKILTHTRQEVPYSSEVIVESFKKDQTKEGKPLRRIHAVIQVARDSQKAILIGTGGQLIKRLATDARKDLEDFLKEKVFLELRIKVDKDWRNDERKLKQYGYFDADSVAASRLAFPNAKINLGLHVIQRRPDGYHEIDSLFIPVPWCDTLEVTASAPSDSHVKLHLHGHQVAGNTKDNLVCRAHALLQKERSLPPVDFHLIKAIPSRSWIGWRECRWFICLEAAQCPF